MLRSPSWLGPVAAVLALLMAGCAQKPEAAVMEPVEEPFRLRSFAVESGAYEIFREGFGEPLALGTVVYNLTKVGGVLVVTAEHLAAEGERHRYDSEFDLQTSTARQTTLDGRFTQFHYATTARMPTAMSLEAPTGFTLLSAAVPLGPQLALAADSPQSFWGGLDLEFIRDGNATLVDAEGPCETGCQSGVGQKWSTGLRMQGPGLLPVEFTLGIVDVSVGYRFVRLDHWVAEEVRVEPTPPPIEEQPEGLVTCPLVPCQGTVPEAFAYLPALDALERDPRWLQWNGTRTVAINMFTTTRDDGSATVLGQVTTPDARATWLFDFAATDGSGATSTLYSLDLPQGQFLPIVEQFEEGQSKAFQPGAGPWMQPLLPLDVVLPQMEARLSTPMSSGQQLAFFNVASPYRPTERYAYQWMLTTIVGPGVGETLGFSAFTGEPLYHAAGAAEAVSV